MNIVYYTGLGDSSDDIIALVRQINLIDKPYVESEPASTASLFLVGPVSTHVIRLAQEMHAMDKHASILVLASPANFADTKRSLGLAAHIGNNVVCLQYSPGQPIAGALESAAARTGQRRSYAKVNLGAVEKNALRSMTVKLQHFSIFLDQAPIGALMLNDAGKILALNGMARRLFRYTGEHGRQITLERVFGVATNFVDEYIHRKRMPDETQVIDRDGFYYEITAADIIQEDKSRLVLLLVRDITGQVMENQRIQSILEALPQMAWTAGPSGDKTFFTTSWYTYTGQDKPSAILNWMDVLHPADLSNFLSRWEESLAKGTVFECIARYRQYNGIYRWHLERGVPVKNAANEISLWTGNCTDIHSQVLLTEELEYKVKDRTASLEKINAELEQYAHVASHDLQEPLRKINIFISILKDDGATGTDQKTLKYLDKISTTATRMARSLKDLLQFSRVQNSGSFEQVDLDLVMRNILDDLELAISQKNAEVRVQPLATLMAVPIQMYQLLYNLVNNALKFSAPGVPPEIRVTGKILTAVEESGTSRQKIAGPRYEISVQDNGIGFEQAYAEHIFTIFKRLHTKDAYEGSGIGLALCKKVVDFHKGEISVVSAPGRGTIFTILLPMDQVHEKERR